MELLVKLGINWQLLLAQIVNFGIVVGVLTLFVYRPLLNLIDQRRERVRKSMEDVQRIDAQKKEMEEFRAEQMKKIDAETGAFLANAKKEAEETKKRMLELAEQEADRILTKGEQKLTEERTRVLAELQGQAAEMIIRATEKILGREFSQTDQKKWIAELTKDLPTMLQ